MSPDPKSPTRKPSEGEADDRTSPGGPAPEILDAALGEATAIRAGARARPRSAPPRLVVVSGPGRGSECALGQAEVAIGRASACAVAIADAAVSRRHALVRREGRAWVLLDQASGNGTRVNGQRIARHVLSAGDEIAIGGAVIRFVEGQGAPASGGSGGVGGAGAVAPARLGAGGPRGLGGDARPLAAWSALLGSGVGGLRRRAPLYALAFALLASAVGAGLWGRHRRELAALEEMRRTEEDRKLAQRRLVEAQRLLGEGRWPEARQQLAVAAELAPGDAEIARAAARAEAEEPRAQALERARAALGRREFAAAREALAAVPADSLLAGAAHGAQAELRGAMDAAVLQAREKAEAGDAQAAAQVLDPVLAAEPERSDALAVRQALRARVAAAGAGPSPGQAGPARAARVREPKRVAAPSAAPILSAYLSGDVASALRRAGEGKDGRSQQLARDLSAFAAAVRDGKAKAQAGRGAEALAALQAAETLDRDIAEEAAGDEALASAGTMAEAWKGSRPGLEVRRSLANLHAALGLAGAASGADEALPGAAVHLRAALAFDPQNQQAQAGLAQVVARAKQLYLRGYVAKEGEPQAARRAFEVVSGTLPPGDETAQKARRWLEKLEGKSRENG